jgi:hypothetical protein
MGKRTYYNPEELQTYDLKNHITTANHRDTLKKPEKGRELVVGITRLPHCYPYTDAYTATNCRSQFSIQCSDHLPCSAGLLMCKS